MSASHVIDISKEYAPVNKVQEDFHASPARHKLLIGGYGAGKTYPSMMEALRHCFKNPGHQFSVFRNTWDELTDNVEKDMVDYAIEKGLADKDGYHKTAHDLVLVNKCVVTFRPLTMDRDRIKGMNLCGFFCDDPDVSRFQETLSFLFSRLRDKRVKASSYLSLWTANYEGRDWLYGIFMKGKKPGDCNMGLNEDGQEIDPYAYWICPTQANPTLPRHYISDLAKIHSESWMKRYVYMEDMDAFSGMVYPDFSIEIHHKSMEEIRNGNDSFVKILVIDNGYSTTHILKMATDYTNVYVYGEWVAHGQKTSQIGAYLREELIRDNYQVVIIDPSSARKEQGTGRSTRDDLRAILGGQISIRPADNSVRYGIQSFQDLLMPVTRIPRFFIDIEYAPVLAKEMPMYRYKEFGKTGNDDPDMRDEVVKRNDHGVDAARYGIVYFKRMLIGLGGPEMKGMDHRANFEQKRAFLPAYRNHPELADYENRRREMRRSA